MNEIPVLLTYEQRGHSMKRFLGFPINQAEPLSRRQKFKAGLMVFWVIVAPWGWWIAIAIVNPIWIWAITPLLFVFPLVRMLIDKIPSQVYSLAPVDGNLVFTFPKKGAIRAIKI